MGENRACRYEPEETRVLERRENRGGGGVNVCASPNGNTGRCDHRIHSVYWPIESQVNDSPPYVGAK